MMLAVVTHTGYSHHAHSNCRCSLQHSRRNMLPVLMKTHAECVCTAQQQQHAAVHHCDIPWLTLVLLLEYVSVSTHTNLLAVHQRGLQLQSMQLSTDTLTVSCTQKRLNSDVRQFSQAEVAFTILTSRYHRQGP